MGKVAPARPDRGRDDLPRWPGTEHMPLYGWKSTMCQSGPPFRGRIGDERTICALRSGRTAFGRGRIGDGDAARRAWGGSSPPRTGIAPRFQAECGGLGGCDGRRGGSAKEGGPGRGVRSAHMFDPKPEGDLFRPSDWHMVRFSPARPDRGRNGRSQGPIALARSATNGRNLARSCSNGIAPARPPPIGVPIGGNRGNLATTPLNGLAKWQHPASQCETGCE